MSNHMSKAESTVAHPLVRRLHNITKMITQQLEGWI